MKNIRHVLLLLCAIGLSQGALAKGLKIEPNAAPLGKMATELGQSSTQEVNTIDAIAAVVNDDLITTSELNRKVALIERQMMATGAQMPDRHTLQMQILNRMIMDRAQLQMAKQEGIQVDDSQVEAAMEQVANRNNKSLDEFLDALKRQGLSADGFRDEVRNELIIGRLKEKEVDSKIKVSDAEVDAYLSNASGKGGSNPPEVNWIQILVKVPANADKKTDEADKAKAEAIEKALQGGKSAADIFQANPNVKIDGTGNMGWQTFDNIPTLFSAFLSDKPIDSTTIIRSPNGYHVLKVVGRRQGGVNLDSTPITQTHVRHILIRVGPDVSDAEAKRRLNFVLEQLKSGAADFQTMAKRYSQDGSAANGGDLGWLYPGDTVPEFEREMDKLKPGEISPVFQSRFGYHILQVVERRQQAASEERQRQAAKAAIRASKSTEAYQDWLQQLRDQTFIDIRLK